MMRDGSGITKRVTRSGAYEKNISATPSLLEEGVLTVSEEVVPTSFSERGLSEEGALSKERVLSSAPASADLASE
jgi:hypothetical protein